MSSDDTTSQLSETLAAKQEHFKRTWLETVKLWGQRLITFTMLLVAGWLIWYFIFPSIADGKNLVWVFLLFWLLIAYAVLPQVHRVLSAIYVPSYFIGRVRTPDGLLGDPVNIGATGDEEDLVRTMKAAGWIEADKLSLKSSWKMIVKTLSRQPYPTAPVSNLMLFGRKQDHAFQQDVGGTTSQRHHVRFWKAPEGWMLPGGFQVDWVGAGTFDRSVGLSLYTLQFTHKIAERTDEERDHIVKTVGDTGMISGVEVIKNFSTGYHHRNGGGDMIVTDGDLPIIHFAPKKTLEADVDDTEVLVQAAFEAPTMMTGEEAYDFLHNRENNVDEYDGRRRRKYERKLRKGKLDSPE